MSSTSPRPQKNRIAMRPKRVMESAFLQQVSRPIMADAPGNALDTTPPVP
jgi:hypothetical protein